MLDSSLSRTTPHLLSKWDKGLWVQTLNSLSLREFQVVELTEYAYLGNRNFLREHHVCMQEDANVCLDQYYWLN